MKTRLLLLALLAVTWTAGAADTNLLTQAYDEGVRLYWSGDLKAAAMKMAEVLAQSPMQGPGNRAAYMMDILEAKLGSNEVLALRKDVQKRYPALAAFLEAQQSLTNRPADAAFARMVDVAVTAPTPEWRFCALQALYSVDWPDDAIAARLDAAAILSELAEETGFDRNPPRIQRLNEQLLRQYVARADYQRQIELRERMLSKNLSSENIIALVRLYRAAGKPDEAYACYTSMLTRVENPAQLGSSMIATMNELKDLAAALNSLSAARAVTGFTNTALLIAESRLLEQTYDHKGAQRVLEGSDDPTVQRAREELLLRLPVNYDLAWNMEVPGAVDVAVDAYHNAQVYATAGPYGDSVVSQVNPQGAIEKNVPMRGGTLRQYTRFGGAQLPYTILPDGTYLVAFSIYTPRGEFIKTLEMPQQDIGRIDGSAAASRSQGIVLASGMFGLTRYGTDGQVVFKGRDPDGLRRAFCSVLWTGTNIALVDTVRAVLYDNQGIRLSSSELGNEPSRGFMGTGMPGSSGGRARTDDQGLVYFASPSFQGVRIFDKNLRFLCQIPMSNAQACAADSDGSVYVVHDGQLSRFAPKKGGARALLSKD